MMIKDAKIFKIIMAVSILTNILGVVLYGQGASLAGFIFIVSFVTGILCGTLRLTKDMWQVCFPKKEKSGITIATLPILIFIWYFKFMWAGIKCVICVLPILFTCVSAPISYFKYKNELN